MCANTSAGLSLLIVMTQKWHGRFSYDTSSGPQKFHVSLTPRVGGIAIFIALIVAWKFNPQPCSHLLAPLLIAGLPVFVLGVAEDLSKRINPLQRLLAAIVTGILAWWLTGYTLNHVDIPPVDFLLAYLPLSIAFTAFAVAGLTNAINIIDGFNGLAGGTVIISLSALWYQTLIQKKITPKNQSAVHWIVDYKPGGTRSKQDIDQQISEERSSWVGE